MIDLKDTLESFCDTCYRDWKCESRMKHEKCDVYNCLARAIEKEKPKKIVVKDELFPYDEYPTTSCYCPRCNTRLGKKILFTNKWRLCDENNYCPVCGQHLDWSGINNEKA